MAKYDEHGNEIPDQTPVEVPLSFKKPLTLAEEVRRMVRNELSQVAENQGAETFEEADDFDVEDDDDLAFMSPYEILEMSDDGPNPPLDGVDEQNPVRNLGPGEETSVDRAEPGTPAAEASAGDRDPGPARADPPATPPG